MTTSQTPVAAAPVAATGTNSRRDPSTPTENTGSGPCLVREGTAVATGEGEAPHATAVPTLIWGSWARHLADDIDEIVVDRLVAGQRTSYTAWERREAVRRLHTQGLCRRQIAERLRITPRQVSRDRERLGVGLGASLRAQWNEATRRRVISARLYAAELRTVEVATLLGVSHGIAHRDRERLGFPSTGFNPTAGRSREELLTLYRHLLDDVMEATA